MEIAIVGDVHGRIKEMYDQVNTISESEGINIEAILQVGDFQAFRTQKELESSTIPEKHRLIGEFPNYLKGVPIPTYFIGGNHENDKWLQETPHGSELVPNLHYLGRSGIKQFNGITLGWVSGNYSPKGFSNQRKKPRYHHFTEPDLKLITDSNEKPDILLTHEWPSVRSLTKGVETMTITDEQFFEEALRFDHGSEELYKLIEEKDPEIVFSGHMHRGLNFKYINNGNLNKFIGLGILNRKDSIYLLDTKTKSIKLPA